MKDSLKYIFLFMLYVAIAAAEVYAIHYLLSFSPLLSALLSGLCLYIWLALKSIDTSGCDPAGAGMAQGLTFIFNVIGAVLASGLIYLWFKFVENETLIHMLLFIISIVYLVLIFIVVESNKKENDRRKERMIREERRIEEILRMRRKLS